MHQTFEGPGFVICSFCPRPLDFDPEAVPIPYNHHNVDSDEMMYYVAGDYSARKGSGVGIGSITLHPSGFTHGPQPGAVEAAIRGLDEGRDSTDETAVMIDTFRPLLLAGAGRRPRTPSTPGAGPGRPADPVTLRGVSLRLHDTATCCLPPALPAGCRESFAVPVWRHGAGPAAHRPHPLDEERPWLSELPVEVRSKISSADPDNRRRFQRHKVSFPLEFRDERVNTPMRVNATDISGNGWSG